MSRATFVALGTGALITSAAAIGIGSSMVPATTDAMSREAFESALAAAAEARDSAYRHCQALAANARELCRAQASAVEMVAAAEVELGFRHDQRSALAAQRARIEARYLVERARCSALGGAARDNCFIATSAAKGRSLLQIQAPYEPRRSG